MTEEGGWKRRMPSNRLSDLREMGSVPVVPVSGHEVPFHGADPNAPGPGEPVGQNHDDLVCARNDVLTLPYEALSRLYDDVPDTLSQLVRTAFIPAPGNRFIVSDFSAIEARVLSWLANETWRLDVFRNDGDIYSATASRMFGVPVAKHGPNAELRQKGKQAELACGYGGSVGALKAMGALEMGMKEEELKPLVDSWRQASPQIVALWNDVGRAAMKAVRERGSERTHGLVFSYEAGFLFIRLPSGRRLAYVKPKVEDDENGRPTLTYEGTGLPFRAGSQSVGDQDKTDHEIQLFLRQDDTCHHQGYVLIIGCRIYVDGIE